MKCDVLRPKEDVIYIRLIGDLDMNILAELYEEFHVEIFKASPIPIYMISDISQITSFDPNIPQIINASQKLLKQEKLGAILTIGLNHPIKIFVAQAVMYISRIRGYFVEDVIEALELVDVLRDHDIHGQWKIPNRQKSAIVN